MTDKPALNWKTAPAPTPTATDAAQSAEPAAAPVSPDTASVDTPSLDLKAEEAAFAEMVAFIKANRDPGTEFTHVSAAEFLAGLD